MKFKLQDVFRTPEKNKKVETIDSGTFSANASKPIDLGDALLSRGSNAPVPAAPTVPVIDCGTFESAQPLVDPIEQKVLAFLRVCHLTDGLTYREVAGGTSLPIADVKAALERLVAAGDVKHTDVPEPNYRRYSLTAIVPEVPAPSPDKRSKEQIWSDNAYARVRAEEAAKLPPPTPRYEPTDAEVQAAMDAEAARKAAAVLTPEQREFLRLTEGRVPRNPQAFVKR
jgi:hypothetical protein